jgi:hypothetical protein
MISLPSLHTLDRAQAARIWLATEPTDMRCGFDRLAEGVRGVIGRDPLSGHYKAFLLIDSNYLGKSGFLTSTCTNCILSIR